MPRMNNKDRIANEIRLSYIKTLYGVGRRTVPSWAELPENAKNLWRSVAKRAEELFTDDNEAIGL